MLNAKLFFRGLPTVDFEYKGEKYLDWMDRNIYANTPLMFNSRFASEQVLPKCTGENDIKYLYCQREYSLISLRQQILQFCKQSYEKRKQLNLQYNLTTTNQTSLPSEELATMSQYFFYVQSMRDRLANMSRSYKKTILD